MAEKSDGSRDPQPRSKTYNVGRAVRHGVLTGLILGGAATASSDAIRSHIEDRLHQEPQGHTLQVDGDIFGTPEHAQPLPSRHVFVGSSVGRLRVEPRFQAAGAPLSVPEQAPQQIPLSGAAESLSIAGFGLFDTAAKRKKSLLALSALAMLVSACGAGVSGTPIVTEATRTPIIDAATIPATPTEVLPTATPTEVPLPSIDVTQAPNQWDLSAVPEGQRTQIESVVTDPAAAGQEARTAFDAFVIGQWQRMLKDAGVPNAEKLKDYALFDAIVEYTQKNNIHEITLPLALHKLILKDPANLVPKSTRPNVPESTDRYYGLEQNVTDMGKNDLLTWSSDKFKTVNFYGEEITRAETDPPFAMSFFGGGARGDLMLLVNLPGVDPAKEQGALLMMYDDAGNRHYFEANMIYGTGSQASDRDLCTVSYAVQQCQLGVVLGQTLKWKDLTHFNGNHPLAKQEIIDFLIQPGSHHVEIRQGNPGGGTSDNPSHVWQNGIGVASSIAFIPTEHP